MKHFLTEKGPKAVGPYSTAVEAAGTVYLSGMLGIDPSTAKLKEGGVLAQAVPGHAHGGDAGLHGLPEIQGGDGHGGLEVAGVGHGGVVAIPIYIAKREAGGFLGQLPENHGVGAGLGQIAAHAFFLGTLAGEKHGHGVSVRGHG